MNADQVWPPIRRKSSDPSADGGEEQEYHLGEGDHEAQDKNNNGKNIRTYRCKSVVYFSKQQKYFYGLRLLKDMFFLTIQLSFLFFYHNPNN